MVKAVKNAIIKIKQDSKLKESLKNKKWNNTFIDIKKLFKIIYKVNKIKTVQDIVKKKQRGVFRRFLQVLLYILYIFIN